MLVVSVLLVEPCMYIVHAYLSIQTAATLVLTNLKQNNVQAFILDLPL